MPHIGKRQADILRYVYEQHERGRVPASINEVALHNAEEPWHQTSNSESCRLLIEKGLLTLDPDHPDAHPRGRGAVLLTEQGRHVAETLSPVAA